MSAVAIETVALRKEFAGHVAVSDLWLEVRCGEVFGFLGPNGAGKTTSVKMLLGLVRPTSGEGRVLGAALGDRYARARVGFLPEHFRFHEHLTARELLALHGRLLGMRGPKLEGRIDELLARVNLSAAADRMLRQMSKGMTQRLGLAQALIGSPDLVFLDEPTSGLDPLGRVLVRELIEELRVRGATVFLNSHLLGEVEEICDRVAFVKEGRAVHELSLADAGSLDLELTLDRVDAATLSGLAAFGSDIRSKDSTVLLRAASADVMPDIARWLVARGVGIHGLASRRKSLEEWFVEVMGSGQGAG
jgi:ABC-2 type transport system ATP-binding protein